MRTKILKVLIFFILPILFCFYLDSYLAAANVAGATGSGESTWYLAEGCTNGFETRVLIQNPNSTNASVTLTYMDQDGTTYVETVTVIAQSQFERMINDITEMNYKSGVSTKIESTNNIGLACARSMYLTNGSGHSSIGVNSPATTWYLAEGCTNGYDTWILIQNPNTTDAQVRLTYMDQDGNTAVQTETVSAERRFTQKINDYTVDGVRVMDLKGGVSTTVESTNTVGIIAERAMYWGTGYAYAHCTCGVNSPATTWYLAEGCTDGFDTWVLIQNPNTTAAEVRLTYMDQDGNTALQTETVTAQRRFTQWINAYSVDGERVMNNKSGVSTMVESTNGVGIIVERAMYWGAGHGHCTHGVTATATAWQLPEGSTDGYDTWILIQNPTTSSANITLTYMDRDGNTAIQTETVTAQRR